MRKAMISDWHRDGKNPFYREEVFLESGIGNNAFSMEKKPEREKLWITPMRLGSIGDLKVGSRVVFQDFDEHGEWREWVGLESAVLCLDYPIPMYVVDNHNHVFYCWMEARKNEKLKMKNEKMTLVHMDAHFDDGVPTSPPTPLLGRRGELTDNLSLVWKYTNEVLQIATYIRPAMELGLFDRVVNYVESKDFERMEVIEGNVVLNVDLDVFCEEMGHVSFAQKLAVLKRYLPQVKLITFATSPSFIDQEKAIAVCKRVVRELFE